MPIPQPHKDEKQDDFIGRCAGDKTMNAEYPDDKQRAAVCYSTWRAKDKKAVAKAVEIAMSKKPTQKFDLSDADIIEVAFAAVPAVPEAVIQLMKEYEPENDKELVVSCVEFAKVDQTKKQVFAYAAVPGTFDKQGHRFKTTDEIEKACHSLMKNLAARVQKGTGSSVNHIRFDPGLFPIESCVDRDGTVGKSLGFEKTYPGGWLIGLQANDDVWAKIQKKEITGVSIAGMAKFTPAEDEGEVQKGSETETSGIIRAVTDAILKVVEKFKPVEKDDGDAKSYNEMKILQQLRREMWNKEDQLMESIRSIMGDNAVADKVTAVSQSIDQFRADIVGLVTRLEAIRQSQQQQQTITQSSKGDEDMKPEELTQLATSVAETVKKELDLDTKLTKIDERLGLLEKVETKPNPEPNTDGVDLKKLDEQLTALEAQYKVVSADIAKLKNEPELRKGDSDPDPAKPIEKQENKFAGTAFSFSG
jgi:hypothetical protein